MSEVYIRVDKETNRITFVHKMPFDPVNGLGQTRDELLKTGLFISHYPEPAMKLGKRAIPYFDYEKKEVSYQYEAIPLTDSQRLDMMESAMNDLIIQNITNSTPVEVKEEETK